jgi:hypothetical protein
MADLKDAIADNNRRPSVLYADETKRKASVAQLTANTTGELVAVIGLNMTLDY